MDMDKLTKGMRAFFDSCKVSLTGRGGYKEKKIPGIAAMCLEIDLKRTDFDNFESSQDDKELEFYGETLTRYEEVCDIMMAQQLMTPSARENLNKSLFHNRTGGSAQMIVVVFTQYNNPEPDKYED